MSMMTASANLANTLKYDKKRDTLASELVDESPIRSPSGRLHHKSLKAAFAAFKNQQISPNSAREVSDSSSPSLYQDRRRPSAITTIKE